MKTFTLEIDEKMESTIESLRFQIGGKATKAYVFRLAIALLRLAIIARNNDQKIVVVDDKNNIKQELVLP